MNSNKFWAAAGRTLATVAVTLTMTLTLAPGAWAQTKYKTLHKFTGGADGGQSWGGLIFDATGNLYGTTAGGGGYGLGTVFKLTRNPDGSWTENVLHSFAGNDGAVTIGGLTFDTSGNLYGVTLNGGAGACNVRYAAGCGVVFKLMPNPDGSWMETVLYSFYGGKDGKSPTADLIFDAAGNLYGMTRGGGKGNCRGPDNDGCGMVFRLDGSYKTVLHYFYGGTKDGIQPDRSGLVFDAAGNLYGTTEFGGGNSRCPYGIGCGTVFRLIPNPDGSWTESVLHHFAGAEGGWPEGNLVLDAAGNIYGVTWLGGVYGYGTVFRLEPVSGGGWNYRVLHQFQGGKDGANSVAGLVFDVAGNLYGTTTNGGAYGYGVVFKLTLGSDGKWRERVLHSFRDHPGAIPSAGVIFDAAGNLYGTTAGDGTNTFGSVFEITP